MNIYVSYVIVNSFVYGMRYGKITLSPTRPERAEAIRLWYAVIDTPVPYTP